MFFPPNSTFFDDVLVLLTQLLLDGAYTLLRILQGEVSPQGARLFFSEIRTSGFLKTVGHLLSDFALVLSDAFGDLAEVAKPYGAGVVGWWESHQRWVWQVGRGGSEMSKDPLSLIFDSGPAL